MTHQKAPLQPQPSLISRFLLLTFAISWGFWGLAILLTRLGLLTQLTGLLTGAGVFGPPIAACLALRKPWKDLSHFLLSGRKGSWIPLLTLATMNLVTYLLANKGWNPELSIGPTLLYFFAMVFISGGPEEPGWRGFLQPALERRFPFPIATVLVGVIWAIWHLPLWLIPGTGPAGSSFLNFFFSVIVLSFAYAGLRKRTQAIWACILLHAWFNIVDFGFIAEDVQGSIQFAGTILMAAFGCYLWYQTDRREKAQAKIPSKS